MVVCMQPCCRRKSRTFAHLSPPTPNQSLNLGDEQEPLLHSPPTFLKASRGPPSLPPVQTSPKPKKPALATPDPERQPLLMANGEPAPDSRATSPLQRRDSGTVISASSGELSGTASPTHNEAIIDSSPMDAYACVDSLVAPGAHQLPSETAGFTPPASSIPPAPTTRSPGAGSREEGGTPALKQDNSWAHRDPLASPMLGPVSTTVFSSAAGTPFDDSSTPAKPRTPAPGRITPQPVGTEGIHVLTDITTTLPSVTTFAEVATAIPVATPVQSCPSMASADSGSGDDGSALVSTSSFLSPGESFRTPVQELPAFRTPAARHGGVFTDSVAAGAIAGAPASAGPRLGGTRTAPPSATSPLATPASRASTTVESTGSMSGTATSIYVTPASERSAPTASVGATESPAAMVTAAKVPGATAPLLQTMSSGHVGESTGPSAISPAISAVGEERGTESGTRGDGGAEDQRLLAFPPELAPLPSFPSLPPPSLPLAAAVSLSTPAVLVATSTSAATEAMPAQQKGEPAVRPPLPVHQDKARPESSGQEPLFEISASNAGQALAEVAPGSLPHSGVVNLEIGTDAAAIASDVARTPEEAPPLRTASHRVPLVFASPAPRPTSPLPTSAAFPGAGDVGCAGEGAGHDLAVTSQFVPAVSATPMPPLRMHAGSQPALPRHPSPSLSAVPANTSGVVTPPALPGAYTQSQQQAPSLACGASPPPPETPARPELDASSVFVTPLLDGAARTPLTTTATTTIVASATSDSSSGAAISPSDIADTSVGGLLELMQPTVDLGSGIDRPSHDHSRGETATSAGNAAASAVDELAPTVAATACDSTKPMNVLSGATSDAPTPAAPAAQSLKVEKTSPKASTDEDGKHQLGVPATKDEFHAGGDIPETATPVAPADIAAGVAVSDVPESGAAGSNATQTWNPPALETEGGTRAALGGFDEAAEGTSFDLNHQLNSEASITSLPGAPEQPVPEASTRPKQVSETPATSRQDSCVLENVSEAPTAPAQTAVAPAATQKAAEATVITGKSMEAPVAPEPVAEAPTEVGPTTIQQPLLASAAVIEAPEVVQHAVEAAAEQQTAEVPVIEASIAAAQPPAKETDALEAVVGAPPIPSEQVTAAPEATDQMSATPAAPGPVSEATPAPITTEFPASLEPTTAVPALALQPVETPATLALEAPAAEEAPTAIVQAAASVTVAASIPTAKTACERADSAAAAPNPSLPLAETDDAVVGEDGEPSIPPELAVSTPPEADPSGPLVDAVATPSTIAQEQAPGASHRGLVEVTPGDPRFRHRHTEEQVGRGERGSVVGLRTKAGFSNSSHSVRDRATEGSSITRTIKHEAGRLEIGSREHR